MGKLSTLALLGTTLFAGNKAKTLADENQLLKNKIKDSKYLTEVEYEKFLGITELEQAIADGHAEVREKQLELEAANIKIDLLETSISELEKAQNENSNLASELASTTEELEQKRSELAEVKEDKVNLAASLSDKEEELSNLQNELSQKDALINELQNQEHVGFEITKQAVQLVFSGDTQSFNTKITSINSIANAAVKTWLTEHLKNIGEYLFHNFDNNAVREKVGEYMPLDQWAYLTNGQAYFKADGTLSSTPDVAGWNIKLLAYN